jgi:RNA polymerase sigma factor (TIGR02999 family)
MMQRILVNAANARGTEKRGGAAPRINLDDVPVMAASKAGELVALDDVLKERAKFDPRKAQVVELWFFGGLNIEETAEVLKISPQSVMRDWKLAKAWLMRELSR